MINGLLFGEAVS